MGAGFFGKMRQEMRQEERATKEMRVE